jgi:zinc/manganese transport system permease protein
MSDISWMILPVLSCVCIVLTLGWFGLHVLERGVIFVDLALAQVAALGTTYAVYLGHEPEGGVAFGMALAFTFIGAAAFSAARIYEERVPQEAIIGIAYAVSAATGILMIHFADDPHGGEKLEHLLVGNIVWVQPADLALLAGVCGAVGVVHFLFRKPFLQISYQPEEAVKERRVALWDLLFYATFGLALTAIVSVSGVLLVFSYLVIPAVIARLVVRGVMPRLLVAWAVGTVVSVLGVAVSYAHPTGPMIVAFFGIALLTVLVVYAVRKAASPAKALGQVAGIAVGLVAVLWGFAQLPPAEAHHHDEDALLAPVAPEGDALLAADPTARDAAARAAAGKPERAEALAAALTAEVDPSVRLTMAIALARCGDARALSALAELTRGDVPFVRMEADAALRALAAGAAPAYDPLAGPDTGAWVTWVAANPALPATAATLELP